MVIFGAPVADRVYHTIRERLAALPRPPRLAIITGAPSPETQTYLELKKKRAESLGIHVQVVDVPAPHTTATFIEVLESLLPDADGVVVQLPLPPLVDRDRLLQALPPSHDCDALNPETSTVLAPVVGAIDEMIAAYDIPVTGARVVVVGRGRLVGEPAARYFRARGTQVTVIDKSVADLGVHTREADIIVCGAGVPGLLTPDLVRSGVTIFDAGTSEEGGVLRGDADPACAEVAAYFTPVPGGIGPVTIAVLLRNLVALCEVRAGSVV